MMEQFSLRVLRAFDPEVAHSIAIKALQTGLNPKVRTVTSARRLVQLQGLYRSVGLAAGFDKNATALKGFRVRALVLLKRGLLPHFPSWVTPSHGCSV